MTAHSDKPSGMDICTLNAGAAAGAVYGTITGIVHFFIGCISGGYSAEIVNGHTTVRTIFGTHSYRAVTNNEYIRIRSHEYE